MPIFQFFDEIFAAMISQSPLTVYSMDSILMEQSQNVTDELHGTRQELILNKSKYTMLLLDSLMFHRFGPTTLH